LVIQASIPVIAFHAWHSAPCAILNKDLMFDEMPAAAPTFQQQVRRATLAFDRSFY
jgi:hypothetical protein